MRPSGLCAVPADEQTASWRDLKYWDPPTHYPHLDIKSVYYRCTFMFGKEGSRKNSCWDGLGHFFPSTEPKCSACKLWFFLSWDQPVFWALVVVFCCDAIWLICPLCCCKSQISMAISRATLLLYILFIGLSDKTHQVVTVLFAYTCFFLQLIKLSSIKWNFCD